MDEQGIRDVLRACEEKGPAWAEAWLEGPQEREVRLAVREWLINQARRAEAERDAVQRRLAEEAVDAAKRSAETASKAAVASQKAARWTMWAAIAAAATALIPLIQAYGILKK